MRSQEIPEFSTTIRNDHLFYSKLKEENEKLKKKVSNLIDENCNLKKYYTKKERDERNGMRSAAERTMVYKKIKYEIIPKCS